MLKNVLPIVLLVSLSMATLHGYAEESTADCKLKGGSIVPLPPAACAMEGGTPVAASAPTTASEPAVDVTNALAADSSLTPAQRTVIDLLSKPVKDNTPLNRNPEGIERSARFDGCKLLVDETMHLEYGNAFSVWRDFKVSSSIDLAKIDRDSFGILGKVISRGGDLKTTAISFEEPAHDAGNALSISVLTARDGGLEKYTVHGPGAYLETPGEDLWIADEYGYPKDTGWGTVAKDRVRILLMLSTADDASKLYHALQDVHMACTLQ